MFMLPLMSPELKKKVCPVPQFVFLRERGGGSVWVQRSVVTKQEQSERHRERRDQVAPPQRSRRWGDASDPGRGQARGQQLLLEGEVVHCQVISEVWERGRRRRGRWMGDSERRQRMKNMRRGREKAWRQLEQTLSQKLKNICGMAVLLLHDVLHSCNNNVTLGERETQAPHRTRCRMLLLQTHAESHRLIFYWEWVLKCGFKWGDAEK